VQLGCALAKCCFNVLLAALLCGLLTWSCSLQIHRARPSWRIKAGDPGGGRDAGGIDTGSVTPEIKPYESFCVPTDKVRSHVR
jgi:hypothetical protein